LGGWYGKYAGVTTTPPPTGITFTAGLLSGLTEAILVVTPAEVCKIRMQSQYHSLMDPSQTQHAKYKNVVQTAMVVTREEGIGALWKGVVPTMLRQGCNQAVNFTVYNLSKTKILEWKKKRAEERGEPIPTALEHWQSLVLGGLSGGMGPCVNNPLDVVKTRMQKQVIHPGKEPKVKFRPFRYIICY
jgi:solute carrier family 25 citrate transporter 1